MNSHCDACGDPLETVARITDDPGEYCPGCAEYIASMPAERLTYDLTAEGSKVFRSLSEKERASVFHSVPQPPHRPTTPNPWTIWPALHQLLATGALVVLGIVFKRTRVHSAEPNGDFVSIKAEAPVPGLPGYLMLRWNWDAPLDELQALQLEHVVAERAWLDEAPQSGEELEERRAELGSSMTPAESEAYGRLEAVRERIAAACSRQWSVSLHVDLDQVLDEHDQELPYAAGGDLDFEAPAASSPEQALARMVQATRRMRLGVEWPTSARPVDVRSADVLERLRRWTEQQLQHWRAEDTTNEARVRFIAGNCNALSGLQDFIDQLRDTERTRLDPWDLTTAERRANIAARIARRASRS